MYAKSMSVFQLFPRTLHFGNGLFLVAGSFPLKWTLSTEGEVLSGNDPLHKIRPLPAGPPLLFILQMLTTPGKCP